MSRPTSNPRQLDSEFSLEIGRERPVANRVGLDPSLNDPTLREHFAEFRSELYQGLSGLLLARREEVGHLDPVLPRHSCWISCGSIRA